MDSLWIVNTYLEFQENVFSNNRDVTKCKSFCTTPTMTKTTQLKIEGCDSYNYCRFLTFDEKYANIYPITGSPFWREGVVIAMTFRSGSPRPSVICTIILCIIKHIPSRMVALHCRMSVS